MRYFFYTSIISLIVFGIVHFLVGCSQCPNGGFSAHCGNTPADVDMKDSGK